MLTRNKINVLSCKKKSTTQSKKENMFFLLLNTAVSIQYHRLIVQKCWLTLPHKNQCLMHKNLTTYLVIRQESQLSKLKTYKNKRNPNCMKPQHDIALKGYVSRYPFNHNLDIINLLLPCQNTDFSFFGYDLSRR